MADIVDIERINNEAVTAYDFGSLLEAQRAFVRSGGTREVAFRREQLQKLRAMVRDNEKSVLDALAEDLRKPAFEAYASEVGLLYAEIGHALDHLESWMQPELVPTPLVLFPAESEILREPAGVVLIIAPWNYPFQLVMAPLVGALAAGNCAVLKPSDWTPHTSQLIAELVGRSFPPELVSTVTGGAPITKALLEERFDHIFFTGSTAVGRLVAERAASHLTPVTLELGGKNPCIVDEEFHLTTAAPRITWSKFLNAGQTCLAPDYLLVPGRVKEKLVAKMGECITAFFGPDPATSEDYARIVSERHFDRLLPFLEPKQSIITGGQTDRETLYIAPTLVDEPPDDSPSLSEEIFGPILPIVPYETLDEAIEYTRRHPDPLALYVFSDNPKHQERLLQEIPSGGGCVNTAVAHFANTSLPFGGRGRSGMGSYHGRYSFEVFSHRRAIMKSSTWLDPSLRYPPYKGKLRWLRKLLR